MADGQAEEPELSSVQLMEQFRAIAHATHNQTNARMSAAGLSLARFRVMNALQSAPDTDERAKRCARGRSPDRDDDRRCPGEGTPGGAAARPGPPARDAARNHPGGTQSAEQIPGNAQLGRSRAVRGTHRNRKTSAGG